MIFRNENPKTLLNRRSFLLGAAQIAGLSLLSGRLYYLQILEREKYHLLAEDNRLSVRLLAPERGKILDRQGLTVAASKANFRLMIVPEQVGKNIVEPLQKISKIINLSPDSLEKLLKEIKKKPRFLPTVIQEGLLWKDVAKIEMSLLDYPGFFIEEVQQRYYPFKEFGAHILGYVSA
ncbi:MAG: penicillin-binding protein 2, partial [Alphaproteobacteria bacterium]|nr:penicillin-binding protein 2 [Alphaproteobacteria bacterium]